MKAYPKYKDSGVEWLGEIPDHWVVDRLKYISKINPSKAEINSFPKNLKVTFLPMEMVSEDGKINTEKGKSLEEVYQGFTYFRNSDVLVAKITPCFENGKGGVCEGLLNGIGFGSTEFHVLRPTTKSDRFFIFYITRLYHFRNFGESEMRGSAGQKRVTADYLQDYKLGVPPLAEQKAIATFLDRETQKIDTLIAKQEQLIALLEEKRQALISHAVTKGLDPNAKMKDSGVEWLGEIPEGWEVKRISSIYRESNKSGNESLPILSISIHSGISDKELNDEELDRKVARSEDKSKYKEVLPNDLAYNMMRAWQGGFGACITHGMVSPAYIVARPKFEFSSRWVEFQLRTPNAITELKKYSRGITDFRLRLYWDEFRIIKITLPPKHEVNSILKFIDKSMIKFDKIIRASLESIELLKEKRSALISSAVTGKIDVRELI